MTISIPALLLDKKKCLTNIEAMANKAKAHGVILKPHFKTHQSAVVGNWFRDFGINSITVSSLDMAMYFASYGWTDITLAFPCNVMDIQRINYLAEKISLNIIITSIETLEHLRKKLNKQTGVYIKIDAGYHRAGISYEDTTLIGHILDGIKKIPYISFRGFLAHAGNSYSAASKKEIADIHEQTCHRLLKIKSFFSSAQLPLLLSVGDTPCCSLADHFNGIDEIRPGNFVFYDVFQHKLGSCSANDIAVVMACPVVGKNKNKKELLLHGGAVHFSNEYIVNPDGSRNYGLVVKITGKNRSEPVDGMYLSSVTQEHGIITTSENTSDLFTIGDMIGILPVHSCLTAHLMKSYWTTDGIQIQTMNSYH